MVLKFLHQKQLQLSPSENLGMHVNENLIPSLHVSA
jgi:hypothetical protein